MRSSKINDLYCKIKRKLWSILVLSIRQNAVYPYIYKSCWHYFLFKQKENTLKVQYFTARPNPGAGIGHQMANWIAGYWFARQFNLKFAHIPFSASSWEDFLGFGINEHKLDELLHDGYKRVKLPLFDEYNKLEVDRIEKIIQSYQGKKIVFVCEQDQFYKDQYGVASAIQEKFYNSPSRKDDLLSFSKEHFNIAIHVRRGDIMNAPDNPNLQMRYIANDYFEKVLDQVLSMFTADKPVHIYFFSQGKPKDFPEFSKYRNLHWCFDMNAQDSFLHMVYADILITSKSSFSYKPALLNKNMKVCPANFWHSYPNSKDWILADINSILHIKENE